MAHAMNFSKWHNVRAQPGAYEGMKAGALPTLGIKGRFRVSLAVEYREAMSPSRVGHPSDTGTLLPKRLGDRN